jgi:orotidine-5'-phosphate decarboxylase
MNYIELLKSSSEKSNSIVCLGLDPVIENIPIKSGTNGERIVSFYRAIADKIDKKKTSPAAVKPNYAFYAQYGMGGIEALAEVIKIFRQMTIPVILDVKRGDIGTTAEAYSREAYEFFGADSVTLSPYMGYDSIAPFVKNYPDKGCYILNKTSNKSSGDLQDIQVAGGPLFLHVSKKIVEWHSTGMGAVVGATYPHELKMISEIFIGSGKEVPLLIPGVGSQGGSVKEIMAILKIYKDPRIHRINSSSAINYAYKKYTDMKFDDAAVRALSELNEEINGFM